MKLAFGHMGFTPAVFWEFTLREWQAAIKGYIEKNYGDPDTPMTGGDLETLMRKYPDDR